MKEIVLTALFFLTAATLITAVYSTVQREAKHSLYIILMSLTIALFAMGSLIVLSSASEETALVGFRLQHVCEPFMGGFWFLYIMDVTKKAITRPLPIFLIMAIPAFMGATVALGDPQKLFISAMEYNSTGIFPYIQCSFTPLYYLGLSHIYAFNLLASVVLIRKLFSSTEESKLLYTFYLFSGFLPFLAGVLSLVFKVPYKREVISTALCIFSIILIMFLLKIGAFRVVATAKYQLFESLKDGIVIFNNRNEYMDSNDSAKEIFPILIKMKSGTALTKIENFAEIFGQADESQSKFTIKTQEGQKHYQFTRSNLLEDNKYIGFSYIIYDITEIEELTAQLKELATIDELTKANNRRHFYNLGEQLIVSLVRLHVPIYVAIMDIDDFKTINDTYGHPFGDVVLKALASYCKRYLRKSDVFGRYGGEEFAAVLHGIDKNAAETRLDQLRHGISQMTIEADGISVSITVSVGFALVDYDEEDPLAKAMSQADIALYQAKKSGKNKVCHNIDC